MNEGKDAGLPCDGAVHGGKPDGEARYGPDDGLSFGGNVAHSMRAEFASSGRAVGVTEGRGWQIFAL